MTSTSDAHGGGAGPTLHIVILGLMGAGKTAVGARVATRLGWLLSDSDTTIEAQQGATVRELAQRLGVDGMHALETRHLHDALADPQPSVICAAASTVDDVDCRRLLQRPEVFVVWLEVDLDTLVRRFGEKGHRPLLGEDPRAMFERQLRERGPLFREVADLRVRERGRRPAQTAKEILDAAAPAQ